MRFLSAPIVRRFLSYVDRGNSLTPSARKTREICRNSSMWSNNNLLNGRKSSKITRSSSVCEINRRCFHHERVKISKLIHHENDFVPNLLDIMKVPFQKKYITLKVDRNFNVDDFIEGAKQALQYITSNLVNENVSALKDITTPECFEKLTNQVERLSEGEKKLLVFKNVLVLWTYIGSIKFDYVSNDKGPTDLVLALKVLLLSADPGHARGGFRESGHMHTYCAEFKRLYGQEKSPWILSGLNVYYMEM